LERNRSRRQDTRLHPLRYVRTRLFGPGAGLAFAEKAAAHDLDTDLELRFSPRVFRQANLAAFAGLVAALAPWVPEGADLCELYAGVGALGLALRPRCARVRCSESNPHAADAFALAAEDQDRRLPDLGPVRFRALDAADAIVADAPGADVLVVDPPRRGLCPEVLEALLDEREDAPAADVRRLIYVSCGFDALERDLARLLAGRRWGLTHAEAHVFFPGSDHVETLAVLDRR
jgi:tRNA/tmRNA/rRNA uracil-C5-methylase (TrmA/RlmC/RlmD family)